MKTIFKIACLFFAVVMFVFACQDRKPGQLTDIEGIFPTDIDTIQIIKK